MLSSRNSRFSSSDISQGCSPLLVYLLASEWGTLYVHPFLSDQISGRPSQASRNSSGETRVRTVRPIGASFFTNKSLYHLGIPGIFCRAAGLGGSPFFLPFTMRISWPDQSSWLNHGSFSYFSGSSFIASAL